jgi:hypothetical protein
MDCESLIKALDYIVKQSDEYAELMLFGMRVAKPMLKEPLHEAFVATIDAQAGSTRAFVAELKEKLLAPSDEPKKDFLHPPWDELRSGEPT